MTVQWMGAIGMLALLVLIFIRIPVGIALLLVGFLGYVAIGGWSPAVAVLSATPFDLASGYALSVIPLFVLMGEFASASGMSSRMFAGARAVFGSTRGSLAYASIGANAGFGAVCGSSIAAAATMTRICVPEMRRHGYDMRLATGAIAAGGTLGILIPPSLIFVIYGLIAQQSVARLFAAGLLPGLVLTMLYVIVARIIVAIRPDWAPAGERQSTRERWQRIAGMWEFALLFTVSVGGIYIGLFSPTEAAAVGAAGALLIGVARRQLSMGAITECVMATIKTTSMLFLIILGATVFAYFVVQARLPDTLIEWIQSAGLSALGVILTLLLAYIVLGCFLEGIGLVLITVPVFLPLVSSLGFDPIWFGVMVVIVVELGLITPPVGMNLFVMQAQLPQVSLSVMVRGVLPFLIAPIVLLVLLLLVPQLATFLPDLLFGPP